MQTSLEHLPDYKQEQLKKITATIVKAVDPEQVILFGSHATGRWILKLKNDTMVLESFFGAKGTDTLLFLISKDQKTPINNSF